MIPLLSMGYLYSKMSEILRDLMNVPAVFYSQDITPRLVNIYLLLLSRCKLILIIRFELLNIIHTVVIINIII